MENKTTAAAQIATLTAPRPAPVVRTSAEYLAELHRRRAAAGMAHQN